MSVFRRGPWVGLFLIGVQGIAQNVNLKSYSVNEGLPQNQVLSLYQDQKGFIWAGTYSGLGRYNGSHWRIYTKEHGLSRNFITDIHHDAKGRLLVGTRNGLNRLDADDRFHIFAKDPFWAECNVADILLDREKRLWVATTSGLARVVDGKTRVFTTEDGLPSLQCNAVYQTSDGRILVATNTKVSEIVGDQVSVLPVKTFFKDLEISSLIEAPDKRLLLGTNRGLLVYANGRFLLFRVRDRVISSEISCSEMGPDGILWFGTATQGVFGLRYESTQAEGLLEPEEIIDIDAGAGSPNLNTFSLIADSENNLWFGTDIALTKYTPSPFTYYTTYHGLANDFVRALHIDRKGTFWMGTRDGLNIMTRDYRIESFDTSKFLSQRIFSIAQAPDGTMFYGTFGGLTTIDPQGGLRNYTIVDGLEEDYVRSVFVDSKDRVWINSIGLARYENGEIVRMPEGHPLLEPTVYDVVEDQTGMLWLGSDRGLIGFRPETDEIHTFKEYSDVTVWAVDCDRDGVVWAASNGHGLFRVEGLELTRFTTEQGMGSNYGWQVLCQSNGALWFGHNRGLDVLEDGRIRHYSTRDGMAEDEGAAATVIEDWNGNLWFGSSSGITRYDPDQEPPAATALPVYLETVNANELNLNLARSAELTHDRNNLEFQFSAPHFRKEEEVRFSFRLVGLNKGKWSAPTTDTHVRFFNLSPGRYRFEVRAATQDGLQSDIASYAFHIMPAWWETWWFRLLGLVGIGILVFGVVVRRLARLTRQQEELERLVNERTRALQSANSELVEAQERLVETAHRAGMAEIATGILHNVGNILNSINVSAEMIVTIVQKSDASGFLRKFVQVMEANRDDMAHFLIETEQGRKVPETLSRTLSIMERNQEKVMKEVNQLRAQIHHINEIVRTQQAYAKVEGYYEMVDVNMVIEDGVRILANMIHNRSIELVQDLKPLPAIRVAKIKLMQVITNLLKNAIEATEKKSDPRERRIQIHSLVTEDNEIEIQIRDNGIGIHNEKAEQLFSYGYTTKEEGHGFGLHFCANAMTEMQGRISVRSEGIGSGACFVLQLPIDSGQKAHRPAPMGTLSA